MKQIIVTGNLGHSATVKEINGREYYSFSLAVAGTAKDSPSEWVDVLYSKFSDGLADFLKSGAKVLVMGRSSVRAYIDKNGAARASESIWADRLEIMKYPEAAAEPSDADGDLPL